MVKTTFGFCNTAKRNFAQLGNLKPILIYNRKNHNMRIQILAALIIGQVLLSNSVSYSQDTLINSSPTEISIAEAIASEMVDVKITGSYDPRIFHEVVDKNGNHYGKCMAMVLQSKIDTFALLKLDCGTQLVPTDSSVQTMIVTREAIFPLYPKRAYVTTFYSMCGELHDASPDISTAFSIGELGDTGLVKLANYLGDNYIQNMPGQHALWAYTDQADFEELKKYGADSLSIEITKDILYRLGLETKLSPKLVIAPSEESNKFSLNRYLVFSALGLIVILTSTIVILIINRPKNDRPIT